MDRCNYTCTNMQSDLFSNIDVGRALGGEEQLDYAGVSLVGNPVQRGLAFLYYHRQQAGLTLLSSTLLPLTPVTHTNSLPPPPPLPLSHIITGSFASGRALARRRSSTAGASTNNAPAMSAVSPDTSSTSSNAWLSRPRSLMLPQSALQL